MNPNLVLIMADQLRHDWLGCAGADWVRTPHLDALSRRSVRFTHCYTNSPVCGPARIALATGLLPHRTGTTSNARAKLSLDIPTYYARLRDHGYRVELVGRHDLHKPGAPGSLYGTHPRTQAYGFTRSIEVEGACSAASQALKKGATGPYTAHLAQHGLLETYADDYRRRRDDGWFLGGNSDSALPLRHHQDVFIGDLACRRIREIEDDFPWYLQVNFQTPHDPFDPPKEYGDLYRAEKMPSARPMEGPRSDYIRQRQEAFAHADSDSIEEARRQYAAKITLLDDQVGRILTALEARGDVNNTVVVFTSDHGEQLGDHGLFSKHTAYDPSWRVPLMVAGPGLSPGISDAMVELSDLGPTFTEMAGLPESSDLDATSFLSVLQGDRQVHRTHCVCVEEGYQAIRTREHKVIRYDDGTTECFDLVHDPDERQCRSHLPEGQGLLNTLTERLEAREPLAIE